MGGGGGGGAIVVGAIPGLGREAVLAVGPRGIRPGTIGPALTPGARVVLELECPYPYPGRATRGGGTYAGKAGAAAHGAGVA